MVATLATIMFTKVASYIGLSPQFAYYAFWHIPNFLLIMLILCFLGMNYADNLYL